MTEEHALDDGAAEEHDIGNGGLKIGVEFAFIKGSKKP